VSSLCAASAVRSGASKALALAALLALAGGLAGCSTARVGHPPPITPAALEEAQTFPYFKTYWVGRSFVGAQLSAADGTSGYNSLIGDSVYYGDCVPGKSVLGGSCLLPLQVTTVIYHLHSNLTLGPQRNAVLRGVPATIYDGGRSIELYSGQVAIDIFSDTLAHALAATHLLRPLNARGSAAGPLPAPVYCPGLYGPQSPRLRRLMAHLPGAACQRAAKALALKESEAAP
jgi:hypothetical protein